MEKTINNAYAAQYKIQMEIDAPIVHYAGGRKWKPNCTPLHMRDIPEHPLIRLP